MREQYELTVIQPEELALKTKEHFDKKHRLVQICAVSVEGGYELSYSFADNYEFINYRLNIAADTEIKSISDMFPSASLYENEMVELFGVKITGIALDYKDKFYKIDAETPFKK